MSDSHNQNEHRRLTDSPRRCEDFSQPYLQSHQSVNMGLMRPLQSKKRYIHKNSHLYEFYSRLNTEKYVQNAKNTHPSASFPVVWVENEKSHSKCVGSSKNAENGKNHPGIKSGLIPLSIVDFDSFTRLGWGKIAVIFPETTKKSSAADAENRLDNWFQRRLN